MAIKKKSPYPDWAVKHRKPGTEIKKVNGRYYLYSVKSVYDGERKRARKISGGILGGITEEKGFVPSNKRKLKEKASKTYDGKEVFAVEYGYAKYLVGLLEETGLLSRLKTYFPGLWPFIVALAYCRTAYHSRLKNIPFHLKHSDIKELIGWDEQLGDQKVSDYLFQLGQRESSIHRFMEPEEKKRRCVLVDATDIITYSNNLSLAHKGYNSRMDFHPQFVLLYLYDAASLQPLYYRILPGNIREISALSNTIAASGVENCIFIGDKGFYSEKNIDDLTAAGLEYIIPLRRGNRQVPYGGLSGIELSDNYFQYGEKRHIFYADPVEMGSKTVCLFLDGMLKEREKNDYLARIESLPEKYTREKFKKKVESMGSLAIAHNTAMNPEELYIEYKHRGDIEQFFDQLKNTIDASSSSMQRDESLKGWVFVNHISMKVIYEIYRKLKTTPLNKKQNLNHKYSIMDTINHLKTIEKVRFSKDEFIITEIDKATRTLLQKMDVHIT